MTAPTTSRWIKTLAFVAVASVTIIAMVVLSRAPGQSPKSTAVPPPADVWRDIFARPTDIPSPSGNPLTEKKIALGRSLFFDKRLSGDGQRSCASCHDPAQGFSDGLTKARGRDGRPLLRNTMTLWNLAWAKSFYWDGRKRSLEEQARVPIEHPNEMGAALDTVVATLRQDAPLRERFRDAFPSNRDITPLTILQALASFERSLVSPRTRFDQWISGDPAAITPSEYSGFQLFVGKAGCLSCHGGWRFADDRFHDIGLATSDLGRGALANTDGPTAPRFKTPGLRELKYSAPYMHDGSKGSLEDVVAHYADGIEDRPSLAANIVRDLRLSQQERNDLVAFLGTLSSPRPPHVSNSRRAE